ncbi:hypothetical protein [Methylosinus sp. LW4]|uniref:hypothetical protein n=1 Tax=Methylosinus sp. LW4 TaxID=136993 RepID=UPI0012FCEF69|nr:hypothetical protein [Methylosinus sp. LW4]
MQTATHRRVPNLFGSISEGWNPDDNQQEAGLDFRQKARDQRNIGSRENYCGVRLGSSPKEIQKEIGA